MGALGRGAEAQGMLRRAAAEDARAKRAQTRTASGIDNYWDYLARKLA